MRDGGHPTAWPLREAARVADESRKGHRDSVARTAVVSLSSRCLPPLEHIPKWANSGQATTCIRNLLVKGALHRRGRFTALAAKLRDRDEGGEAPRVRSRFSRFARYASGSDPL